jgi:hypothetical protein
MMMTTTTMIFTTDLCDGFDEPLTAALVLSPGEGDWRAASCHHVAKDLYYHQRSMMMIMMMMMVMMVMMVMMTVCSTESHCSFEKHFCASTGEDHWRAASCHHVAKDLYYHQLPQEQYLHAPGCRALPPAKGLRNVSATAGGLRNESKLAGGLRNQTGTAGASRNDTVMVGESRNESGMVGGLRNEAAVNGAHAKGGPMPRSRQGVTASVRARQVRVSA